ncbi:hypothetical protein AMAG_04410 [Allomyces macrogynus ATCC 38327]|uniref:Rhodanese domain-containing protein n=1 Tax=Allomyces macrogynus (strain ATCC 38327) TaxID=578462 RepID=A0A0L0S8F0_ALLM3|nr:hypothetical protein AMAG_04410 [Allomyces macrogynus ATCC 38327]|eukprot:KNE58873.1 hypothetical protein AMAG_04410 [Allomyces macrogynus ATCC 38327]
MPIFATTFPRVTPDDHDGATARNDIATIRNAKLIDVRPAAAYLAKHIRGSFALSLPAFATRADFPWFLLPEKSVPVAVIVPSTAEWTTEVVHKPIDKGTYRMVPDALDHGAVDFVRYLVTSKWNVTHVLVDGNELWASAAAVGYEIVASTEPREDRDRPFASSAPAAAVPERSPSPSPPTMTLVADSPTGLPAEIIRTMRLPFDPAVVLERTASFLRADAQFPSTGATVLDLGCGAGRDIMWLLHKFPDWLASAVGVDSWKGSCDRTSQAARVLAVADRVQVVRARLDPFGAIKPAIPNWPKPFDWVLLHRFLPPRTFAPTLHTFLNKPGAVMMLSTFQLPVGMGLDEWVAEHETPTSLTNLLVPGELTRPLNEGLLDKPDAEVMARASEWGWGFTKEAGYEVLRNETVVIADGRPLVWFVARKI